MYPLDVLVYLQVTPFPSLSTKGVTKLKDALKEATTVIWTPLS